ncbi:uncharacterized protein K452DRAFT_340388 [Aplosporella prunicola CBS 121167]|uniref:Uncharacterized protein n=1 Tax=Aplosporella prunicola CBS 121167 TaxID=1176127 RepID=A0A6A6BR16_9PEZI|nr:uncharacterized protein K452DRAFT_340388 [Aplosporella prunicola CBS 121167]KAF2145883.1 hypothetical protein K452DRAFT_340388 [Aplosporella prunicola CBS 121167]
MTLPPRRATQGSLSGHDEVQTASQLIPPEVPDQSEVHQPRGLWSPLFLRPHTLALFACAYLMLSIILAALAWYSSIHKGICAVNLSNHYLWNYAPTALFTLFSVLWSQIDYRTRSIMPWVLMARKLQTADRSVLLDYVSPNLVSAWIKAIKAKDIPVAISIFGAVLNKLLIILSTSLFTLDIVNYTTASITTEGGKSFVASAFNASLVNQEPVARVFGTEHLEMGYTIGTSKKYAAEVPPLRNSSSTLENTSQVDIISASLDCEDAGQLQNSSISATGTGVHIGSSPNGDNETYYNNELFFENHNGTETIYQMLPYVSPYLGGYRMRATLNSSSCSSIQVAGGVLGYPNTLMDRSPTLNCSDDSYRFVFGLYGETSTGERGGGSQFLVCKPTYRVQAANMTYKYDTSEGNKWTIKNFTGDRKLENFTAETIFEGFYGAIKDLNITVLLNRTSPQAHIDPFLHDLELLKSTLIELYEATTAQILSQHLLVENTKTFQVAEIRAQSRLQLQGYGLWSTECALILLAVISLSLCYSFKASVLPRDIGSITGLATILARDPEFMERIDGSGSKCLQTIRRDLFTTQFQTEAICNDHDTTDVFRIRPLTTANTEKVEQSTKLDSGKWYNPFVVTRIGRLCTIAIAVILVIALESIYQTSIHNHGFMTVAIQKHAEYTSRYIPAAILVLYSLLFSALDFELKTFQPYLNLRKGSATSQISIDEHYLGLLGLHGLWRASRKKQYCIVATTIGMFVTHFLTIIASGLYTVTSVYQQKPIQVLQMDRVNIEAFSDINHISYQEIGMIAATLVLDKDMDLPQWSYDSFIVPTMDLVTQLDKDEHCQGVTITVPATRANANCTVIIPSNVSIEVNDFNQRREFTMDFDFLSICGGDPRGKRPLKIDVYDRPTGFASWNDRSDDFFHCPEYLVVAGHAYPENRSWNLRALHCRPYLESIDVRIELSCPGLIANRKVVPLLDESTRKTLSTAEVPGIDQNLLLPYIRSELEGIDRYLKASDGSFNGTVDGFFGTVVRRGTPLKSLTNNSESLKAAVEDMYPRIMAQILNQNRVKADPKIYNGTAQFQNRFRLVQNGASTRVLQALLVAMALCIAATLMGRSTKGVLPKNPRSIAAVASLLAGSSLLHDDIIPPGSEWLSDEELECRELFKGLAFSIGWWKDEDMDIDGQESVGFSSA